MEKHMKTCTKCGVEKSFCEFGKNRTRKDGLNCWCKSCRHEYNVTRRIGRRSPYDVPMLLNGVATDNGWLMKCTKCGEIKDLDCFYHDNNKKFGYCSACKECQSRRKRTRRPGQSAIYGRMKKFGISNNGYLIMLENQDFSCAICGVHADKHDRALAVDHNHETGSVRGLLCRSCNVALGLFQDSQHVIRAAAEYLEEFDEKYAQNTL